LAARRRQLRRNARGCAGLRAPKNRGKTRLWRPAISARSLASCSRPST
jgi:hypothetical protein